MEIFSFFSLFSKYTLASAEGAETLHYVNAIAS